jgi:hypothetical protein
VLLMARSVLLAQSCCRTTAVPCATVTSGCNRCRGSRAEVHFFWRFATVRERREVLPSAALTSPRTKKKHLYSGGGFPQGIIRESVLVSPTGIRARAGQGRNQPGCPAQVRGPWLIRRKGGVDGLTSVSVGVLDRPGNTLGRFIFLLKGTPGEVCPQGPFPAGPVWSGHVVASWTTNQERPLGAPDRPRRVCGAWETPPLAQAALVSCSRWPAAPVPGW